MIERRGLSLFPAWIKQNSLFAVLSLASASQQAQIAPFRQASMPYPCLRHLVQGFALTTGTISRAFKLISLPPAANQVILNMNLMTSLTAIKPSMAPYCSQNKVQVSQPNISGLVQVGHHLALQLVFHSFPTYALSCRE